MTAALSEQLVADRTKLRLLSRLHPDWPRSKFREELGRSLSWIKTWLARFRSAPPLDLQVLWGRSRRPKTPPPPPDPRLLDRLLELRNNPPACVKRVPGPKTLSYLLQNDPQLKELGITPPRSTSTIYKLLVRLGCFARPALKQAEPLSRAEPLESIAIDFKDCNSVEVEPDGKKQHLVEILNMLDEGTSVLWAAVARTDFNAETGGGNFAGSV